MCSKYSLSVNLGFTDEHFPAGTHICQLYSEDSEREETLLKYLKSGLANNERVACFSDKTDNKSITQYLTEHHLDCDALKGSSRLTISAVEPIYFKNNRFEPEEMLETLKLFHNDSIKDGQSAARVIGEMTPKINSVEGGERLMEYEARVCNLLETHPVTAVCQYNVDEFDGETIMNVLKVHPLMLIKGAVIRNPFFIQPEEILKQAGDTGT